MEDWILEQITEIIDNVANLGRNALRWANVLDQNVVTEIDRIGLIAVRPVASILLALFAVMQIYKLISYLNDVGAPASGSARLETVGFALAKIGFIYWVIQSMTNIMWGIVSAGTYLTGKINEAGQITGDVDISRISSRVTELIEEMGDLEFGFSVIGAWSTLWIVDLIIAIAAVVVFVLFYGRILQIYIMVALAPLPLVTLIHDEQKQIGINFIKSFVAVVLQGAIMMLCIWLYSVVITTAMIEQDTFTKMVWSAAGVGILFVVSLATSGMLAKRVTNAM